MRLGDLVLGVHDELEPVGAAGEGGEVQRVGEVDADGVSQLGGREWEARGDAGGEDAAVDGRRHGCCSGGFARALLAFRAEVAGCIRQTAGSSYCTTLLPTLYEKHSCMFLD